MVQYMLLHMLGSMESTFFAIPVGSLVLKLQIADQGITTALQSYCCCRNVRKYGAHLHRKM